MGTCVEKYLHDFRAGDLSIEYLEEHAGLLTPEPPEGQLVAAAVAAALLEEEHRTRRRLPRIQANGTRGMSAWRAAGAPGREDAWVPRSP